MAYHGNETYLVLEVSNNPEIDLEVDYLKVNSVKGNKKRKASYQQLEMNPIYSCQVPIKFNKGDSKRFVYVLPKFVLGVGEQLVLELL